jgi:hypothetical protein
LSKTAVIDGLTEYKEYGRELLGLRFEGELPWIERLGGLLLKVKTRTWSVAPKKRKKKSMYKF